MQSLFYITYIKRLFKPAQIILFFKVKPVNTYILSDINAAVGQIYYPHIFQYLLISVITKPELILRKSLLMVAVCIYTGILI